MHDRRQHHRAEPNHLDRYLDALDLETDLEDVQLDRQQVKQLASLRRLVTREGDRIMGALEDLNTSVDTLTTAQADTKAQIGQLATQVQALIDAGAGSVSAADLGSIVTKLNDLATAESAEGASVDAIIEPDAGEGEPPAEEPA